MSKVLVCSGKYGGLRAMLGLIRRLVEAGNEVVVLLTDEHTLPGGYREESVRLLHDIGAKVVSVHHDSFDRMTTLRAFFGFVPLLGQEASCCIVYGDRLDALLATAAAYEVRLPVLHLQAGDQSGGVDDAYRRAISQMATEHFAPTKEAVGHLRYLGVDGDHIHHVGDHHVDAILSCAGQPENLPDWMCEEGRELVIVHLHPDTLANENENRDIALHVWSTVRHLQEDGYLVVAMPPCNDRGSSWVLPPHGLLEREPVHLPMEQYVPLLETASLFIGNSSTAVIECPVLRVPTLLVGNRQRCRSPNSWLVPRADLLRAARQTLSKGPKLEWEPTYRGDGQASKLTYDVMRKLGYAS